MQFKLKFFLPVLLLLFSAPVFAQVSPGSLGDPVFTFDFGSGNTPQFPITSYTYVAGSCPEDGSYSLSKTETGCHDDTWHRVLKDHTGNDGYMMVVNADTAKGKEFFSKQSTIEGTNVGVLCENTKYEFSAYILNLIKAGQNGFIEPRISFIFETLGGERIGFPYTVDVHATSDPNGWLKYATYITTPHGETAVVVKMVNDAPGGNGNDLLLDDIAFRPYGPIVQAGFDGKATATEQKACEGDMATDTIKADVGPEYTAPAYQWQNSTDDGYTWANITNETNTTLIIPPHPSQLGNYQYRLVVAEEGNINSLSCRVYSNPVTIKVTSYPNPPEFPPVPVCEGDVLRLPATGGVSYKWTLPDSSVITQNPLIIPYASMADKGLYKVEIISAANCSTFRDVTVTVNPKPVVTIDPIQPICKGSSGTRLTASVNEAGPYTYSWLPATGLSDANASNPMASPNISTLYTVIATNSITTCSDTTQIRVEVLDLPVANAGNDKKIFEGQSIKLDGTATGDIATYTWSPPDYLDDPHSPTPMASPPHNMPYLLTVTSTNGCGTDADGVFVRVYQKIVIPSTFTPNNDGVNDIWNIEALETYPLGTITVYTRNGKQVFQSKGYGKPWDGKLNGALLPTGTYYYVIDLKNDTPNLSGWVLLVR
ncbi:gliding motility-associated C-terminal domain-containing protein [Mucilaginibacter aquariorum]|uniref:Gliding motility-associated C-terminal domain-containing protein n=1 Tax=Mucilaginibacter aquariorum TaxID=2967225 RepID=A0ABT1T6B0_9SPHI|nr:gliding motility-associated C-terminal domain-containing protein [Mucilaginibacter aquariorum]MCQ6960167.1 gliding motility-associated C-terminal domain-containing protein [Mucilaginibacter aquariorum]